MAKTRLHREYFRKIAPKKCECGTKGKQVYSWGNYVRVRWVTVKHFCEDCFAERVQTSLNDHTADCGCEVELVGYQGMTFPKWLTLAPACQPQRKAA